MRNLQLEIMVGVISLMVISAGNGRAQPRPSQEPDELQPRSTSPREIARVINKSKRIWNKNRVQVSVNLNSVWKQFGIDSGYFSGCAGDCEAKIFRHELDSRSGEEVILKLTRSFDFCRYLIFTRVRRVSGAKFRLRFVGYIDHEFNRYQMSSHRIVRAFGRNWLVVRGQEGSGSGYSLYGETWYEVTKRGVRPVLNYSAQGQTDPAVSGLRWQFENRPAGFARLDNGRPRIDLRFVVEYTANGIANEKFTDRYINRRLASYVWSRRSRTFVFDPKNSNISEMEMDIIANIETEPAEGNGGTKIGGSVFFSGVRGFVGSGFEMFIRLNFSRLMKIVRGRNLDRKEWLSEFLKECNEIPEKLLLSNALQNPLPVSRKQR